MFASTKRQSNNTTESLYLNVRWLTSITVRRALGCGRILLFPCYECHCYGRCCEQAKAWGLS